MRSLKIIFTVSLLVCAVLVYAQPAYPVAPPAPGNIMAIEYFIDNDPGFGNGISLTIAAAADIAAHSATIPLAGVTSGIHRLFIRSRDNMNNWTLTGSVSFDNFQPAYTTPVAAPLPVTGLEVFFDNDPGFGNGIKLTVPTVVDLANFNFSVEVDTLSSGAHTLYIRSLSNDWSFSAIRSFSKDIPLPLSWLYIRAQLLDGQSLISWGTAQENNTSQFAIEHSTDGSGFTTIGTVPAAGNSSLPRSYQWTDVNPIPGMNYYRIRQTDLDGKFTWSGLVSLLYRNGLTKTIAAPNPALTTVDLLFASPATSSMLKVYNTEGRMVLSEQIAEGVLQHRVDLGALPSGIYILQLSSDKGKETIRVMKK